MQGSDNMENLPLFKLTIKEDETAIQEVNAVALVDIPAIGENFFAFQKHEFVEPKSGETEEEFIPRCIAYNVGEGKDQDQAAAICYDVWDRKQSFQSYSDYPETVRNNAKRGIKLNEENGNKCATQVGKVRAQQLANGEPVSVETIKRMYSYLSRAEVYYDQGESTDCGYISYLLWGGKAAKDWAESKLNKLEAAGEKVSIDYDGVLSTDKGKELAKRLISEGKAVYIISARRDTSGMEGTAKELGISSDKIYATGSNKAKVEKIKELGIVKHYDNNQDVIDAIPGIGDKFNSFSFAVVNNEERIVVGPAMIPDLPIYRRDETGEYYVFFDRKTIETIALKFYAKGFQQSANEMHMKPIEGVTFFQSWIADESKGIPKMKQFEDLPDGTWFLGAKVNNDETWQKVKDGTFRGFSVEGMFDMTEIKMRKSADEIIMKLRELLRDL